MTRTAADDAAMPCCSHASAACPPAVGIATAVTGVSPGTRRPGRPGRARLPFLRHRPGAPHQPELRYARPFDRSLALPGNAATPAGWPADPGRDI